MRTTYGPYSATSIVVANMIGTGIFTSLGFQVMELQTGFALLTLWLIGGITALIGAMAYAELGAGMSRSGGEYHFLSRIYHPSLGFVSGWISFIVGFAAPTAAASLALGTYFTAATGIEFKMAGFELPVLIALSVIISLSVLHARAKRAGAGFQNIMTSIKILVLLAMIFIGWGSSSQSGISFSPDREALSEIISAPFAIALFFVSFAYSGWNAAAYITGEISSPEKNIPRSLILGTLCVTILYMGITWIYLKLIPIELLSGRIEVGYVFGQQILGSNAATVMGILFAVLLFSNVSSLVIIGPRITQVMGEDYVSLRWFSHTSRFETPARAIYIQGIIAVFYLLSSTFEQMITYIGFTLNLMTLLTVLGLMIRRSRRSSAGAETYQIKPYPLLPLIFILINTWIMIYGMIYKPLESIAGLLTAGLGYVAWLILRGGSTQLPGGKE